MRTAKSSNEIWNPGRFRSSGCEDELTWAAAWLYRATGEKSYLNDAEKKYVDFGLNDRPSEFSWDDKNAGVQVCAFLSCSRFDADPATKGISVLVGRAEIPSEIYKLRLSPWRQREMRAMSLKIIRTVYAVRCSVFVASAHQ